MVLSLSAAKLKIFLIVKEEGMEREVESEKWKVES